MSECKNCPHSDVIHYEDERPGEREKGPCHAPGCPCRNFEKKAVENEWGEERDESSA